MALPENSADIPGAERWNLTCFPAKIRIAEREGKRQWFTERAAAALMAGAPIGWDSLLRQPGGLGCEGKVVKPWPFGGRWWRPASANPRRGEPAWPGGARIEKARPGWTLPVRRSESRVPANNPWV